MHWKKKQATSLRHVAEHQEASKSNIQQFFNILKPVYFMKVMKFGDIGC